MERRGAGRRAGLALAAIFVLALGVRFAFWSQISGTALDQWHRFDQSDMATYVEQARRIREESLTQPDPYHPYHSWQTVAPAEKWLSWYGPHAFHQAPLYSYLLALVMPFAGAEFQWVKGLQLLLGAGSCVWLALIARRLWSDVAGLAAGLLAACYGPLVFLEAQLLREGPAVFCILGLSYGLLVHLERGRGGTAVPAPGEPADRPRSWLPAALLGLGAGLFSMFHEMANVVTLALLVCLAAHGAWGSPSRARAGALAAGAFLGAWFVGFSPLFARNLAVGAAPFSVSCRTTVNFVESNVADAPAGGATFEAPSPTAVRVLDEAQGSGLAALKGTWASYGGDLGRVFDNLFAKFAANGIPWEVPDNTSFEFFREQAPVLRFAPTFALVFPLGFAGLLLALARLASRAKSPARSAEAPTKKEAKRQRKLAESQGPLPEGKAEGHPFPLAGHLALLLLLAGLLSALSLVHTVARFRMYLVPLFILYGSFALAALWDLLRERRLGRAALIAGLVLAGVQAQRSVPTEAFVRGLRNFDYALACKFAIEGGRIDEARSFAARAALNFPRDGLVYSLAGQELERKGERTAALDFYRRALTLEPNAAMALQGLRRLEPR
ncbi:MAG: glycosyltransferase family 39 protein [Planctomycetes bacterium]|nr:glycosyltransferase family 39 protein [Planctomycetota bacterium]